MSSQACAICGPKRTSRALCNCCQQYLCRDHLQEHDHQLNVQLEPLANHTNELIHRLQQFPIDLVLQPTRLQLDQWRDSALKSIERIYEEKSNEINQSIRQQLDELRQRIAQTQQTIAELIHQQDATNDQIQILTKAIENIEKQTNDLEHQPIELNIRPLIADESYIQLGRDEEINNEKELMLSPVIENIGSTPLNSDCLSGNDRHILLHRHPTLCLYNHNLNFISQTPPYDDLSPVDMCWSSTLEHFLVLTKENLFILNPTRMILEKSNIPTPPKGHWHSLTCSSHSLYLTAYKWGSSLYQYHFNQLTFRINRRWKQPISCNADESIDHLMHNQTDAIAMIIQHRVNNRKSFQLRNDQTLERIWSVELRQCQMTIHRTRFTLINPNQWIIVDSTQSKFFVFTADGLFKQMIDYPHDQPYRTLPLTSNFLLVTTKNSINLHQIQF